MARILWGEPILSPKVRRDLEEGRLVLGGCCVTDDDPAWKCVECDAEVHRFRERYRPADKFCQPIGGIEIVSTANSGTRTWLSDEAVDTGRRRVAAGEDVASVAFDLALDEVAMVHGDWAEKKIKAPRVTKERLKALWKMREVGAKPKETAAALGLNETYAAMLVSKVDEQKRELAAALAKT